jgi:hypothetical protein
MVRAALQDTPMITLVRVIASESDLNHSTIHNTEKLALFLLSSETTQIIPQQPLSPCHVDMKEPFGMNDYQRSCFRLSNLATT